MNIVYVVLGGLVILLPIIWAVVYIKDARLTFTVVKTGGRRVEKLTDQHLDLIVKQKILHKGVSFWFCLGGGVITLIIAIGLLIDLINRPKIELMQIGKGIGLIVSSLSTVALKGLYEQCRDDVNKLTKQK